MLRRISVLLMALSLLSLTSLAQAQIREKVDNVTYEVKADASQSLGNLINAASPINEDGRLFHGYTKWFVKWNLKWNSNADGACKLSNVNIDVDVKVTLPVLVGSTSSVQKRQFNVYLAALKEHEMGHVETAQKAAVQIEKLLNALPQMASCAQLQEKANALGEGVLKDARQRDLDYDAGTKDGREQGAVLE